MKKYCIPLEKTPEPVQSVQKQRGTTKTSSKNREKLIRFSIEGTELKLEIYLCKEEEEYMDVDGTKLQSRGRTDVKRSSENQNPGRK